MNCPDASTLAEASAILGSNTRDALGHLADCPECRATLALCDQLATEARSIDVPPALYDRIDEAIRAAADGVASTPAQQRVRESETSAERRPWHTPVLASVSVGVSLLLVAAMAPSTSGQPIHWPALMVMSALGGLAFTRLEQRRGVH